MITQILSTQALVLAPLVSTVEGVLQEMRGWRNMVGNLIEMFRLKKTHFTGKSNSRFQRALF